MTIVLVNKKKIRMIKNKENPQILKDILDTNNSLGYRIGIKENPNLKVFVNANDSTERYYLVFY